MARASVLRNCSTLIVLLFVGWLAPISLVSGQQAPPAGPSAPQPGEPAAPTGQAAPPPGGPAGQAPTQPGAPAEQVAPQPGAPAGEPVFPEPIFPGFPSPTIPVGEPVGPIPPVTTLRFAPLAPLPLGVSPLQIRTFFTAEEEYTDNANQSKTNKKSEIGTSLALGVAAHLEGSRSNLDLAYAPRAFLPRNTPKDTVLDHDLTLRGGVFATPLIRFNVADDFTHSTDFRDVGNIGTTRTGQNAFTSNRGTAEAIYAPLPVRLGLAYTNILIRNDVANPDNSDTHNVRASGDLIDPRFAFGGSYTLTRGLFTVSSDYWSHNVEGHARRPITPTLSATFAGSFTEHDADQVQATDFRTGRALVGGEWVPSPGVSLSGQAGADIFAPKNDKTIVRPSILALWSQRFTYFALSVSYSRSFQQNFDTVDNTGVSYTESASVYLTSVTFRDLSATVGARWNRQKFQQNTSGGGAAGTRDTTWDIEARIQYVLARPLYLTLGYIYTIRSSTDPNAAFVENRVRLGLTYQYNIF